MEIHWLGHSCLRIQTGLTVVVTDPFDSSLGISMRVPQANIVTISHDHPHHANVSAVGGEPHVIDGPGEYEIGNVYVRGIGTGISDDEEDRRINTVYMIHSEGLTLCHLGEIGAGLSNRQAQELNNTDVLVVPAGGTGSIGVDRIAALVSTIDPRIVIPVHYQIDGINVELSPVDDFLKGIGVADVAAVNRLNVTQTNLPREMRTVVLQRTS